MIGGINGNSAFPITLEENEFQCDSNALTQLQLFGNFPAGLEVNPGNYAVNSHVSSLPRPSKRSREVEDSSRQHNPQISFHNNCHARIDKLTTFPNPNDVSTGLKLSYDDDEHNSSITSASGSMPSLNIMMPLSDNFRTEIDRQKEELDNYIRMQEQLVARGVRELKERHTASILNVIEKDIDRKLREKDIQIESINKKNKELVERIKQVSTEAQSWQCRARYNETMVSVLKKNLKQAIAQGGDLKEGCGDSEVDDAVSSYSPDLQVVGIPQASSTSIKRSLSLQTACKSCKNREISMLLLPCRHVCLCKDCDVLVHRCPVCHSMKTSSMPVYMS